ncbi:MAG: hypothetical protein QOF20_1259 [Acidimicrobiaceae bacterium]|nr:hypothetical protein [Acidimicrobiaceae bacterium]
MTTASVVPSLRTRLWSVRTSVAKASAGEVVVGRTVVVVVRTAVVEVVAATDVLARV